MTMASSNSDQEEHLERQNGRRRPDPEARKEVWSWLEEQPGDSRKGQESEPEDFLKKKARISPERKMEEETDKLTGKPL